MRIDSPFARVNRRQMKMAEIDPLAGRDVVQVRRLQTLFSLGIRVVQNPLIAGQVAQVPARIEYAVADLLDIASAFVVFKQEITPVLVASKCFD